MIARLAGLYLLVFAVVLAAISAGAYFFVAGQYHSLLLPALGTPEGATAYARALRRIVLTIVAFDVPLLAIVGAASALLARLSLRPLLLARDRERVFVADAAHELRSPLATIAAVAQAAGGSSDPKAASEALELIAKTSLDAGALLADLLTLAREPEARLLSVEPVDLAALAKDCARELQPQMERSALAFDLNLTPAIVDGDERRLRELIRNLLENAKRHAKSRVGLRVGAVGEFATLVVADDGAGIPPADRDRLFDRFVRGEHQSGTGLGLSIAKWIVTAHHGTLRLEEAAEAGAIFSVQLPLLLP